MLPLTALGPVIIVCMLAEFAWSHRQRLGLYSLKESLASVGTAVINQIAKVALLGWKYLVLAGVASFVPWSIQLNVGTVLVGYLAVELFYYWYHRASHEIPVLWTMHFIHHSSPEYNLLVAPRLSALSHLVTPFFFIPLVLVGYSPEFIVAALAIGLFLQFFLHTQAIGELGRLEGWINTPSAHRVHHGTNPEYIDKNYGGALIVFDRLFGTYQPEGDEVRFGVTTGHWGFNPFRLQFEPMWRFLIHLSWGREKDTSSQPATAKVDA